MDINNLVATPAAPVLGGSALRKGLLRNPQQSEPMKSPKGFGRFISQLRPALKGESNLNASPNPKIGFLARRQQLRAALNNPQLQQQQNLGTTGNFQSSGALSPSDILRLINLGQG